MHAADPGVTNIHARKTTELIEPWRFSCILIGAEGFQASVRN